MWTRLDWIGQEIIAFQIFGVGVLKKKKMKKFWLGEALLLYELFERKPGWRFTARSPLSFIVAKYEENLLEKRIFLSCFKILKMIIFRATFRQFQKCLKWGLFYCTSSSNGKQIDDLTLALYITQAKRVASSWVFGGVYFVMKIKGYMSKCSVYGRYDLIRAWLVC